MMINWKLLTRNCEHPEKFKEVYDTRVALKKAGKKKEQAPLKIILNSQFGITKDKNSDAFDPVQANNICINGQLMLLDLIDKLENKLGDKIRFLNLNTDGLIVEVEDDSRSLRIFEHICTEWCIRTKMGLGTDELGAYISKDVNNYVSLYSFQKDVNVLESRLKDLGFTLKSLPNSEYEVVYEGNN